MLAELLRHGRVRRAWLGLAVRTQPLARRVAVHHGLAQASCVTVDEVLPEGPAARAGLVAGDRILAIDGLGVADVDDLHRAFGAEQVGRSVRVDLLRGTQRIALDLVPRQRE